MFYTQKEQIMIDSFKVKANPKKNLLLIQLRGYFMKSELELAFFLARKESKKLEPGFSVVLDLDGMYTNKGADKALVSKAKRIFETLGAKTIRSIGAIAQSPKQQVLEVEYFAFESVGLYPN